MPIRPDLLDSFSVKASCPRVLITGGAGYIGSHTVLEFLERGYDVVVVDDLSNSSIESLRRVESLTHRKIHFHKTSICDQPGLSKVFALYPKIDGVIHFAGQKSVTESISNPLNYYTVNVYGSIVLVETMVKFGVYNLVFSSSATVYGQPEVLPIPENHTLGPTNPYGRSKLMVEDVIRDVCGSCSRFNAALLRYFNPVGAHLSGQIGEDPKGVPNNLMPYLSQVLVGKLPHLNIYGSDYSTADGTGVRDFIHVVDLARGHLAALDYLHKASPGCVTYNMGTGTGYSVLQMVKSMETVSGRTLACKFAPRRPGDVGEVVADPTRARAELGWRAQLTIDDMCADTWRWQTNNPHGYVDEHSDVPEDISVSTVSDEDTSMSGFHSDNDSAASISPSEPPVFIARTGFSVATTGWQKRNFMIPAVDDSVVTATAVSRTPRHEPCLIRMH